MFIPKKSYATAENIAEGEYNARIERIRMTKDNESVMFICAITNEGFNNAEICGFARANWNKPSGRTTANLLQWCKNLGADIVEGQEDQFDIESLVGKQCRIIVQSYVMKTTGEPRVKVSNILPFDKRPVPNPMTATQTPQQPKGIHIGTTASAPKPAAAAPSYTNTASAQQAAPSAAPAFVTEPGAPVENPTETAATGNTGSETSDNNLW